MRLLLLFLIVALISPSCKNNPGADQALVQAEKQFNDNPNEENYSALIGKYLEKIRQSTSTQDISGLLVNAVQASRKSNHNDQELLFLNNLVKAYPDRSDKRDNILRLIELLHKAGKHTTADELSYAFLKAYPGDNMGEELKNKLPKGSTPEDYIAEIGRSIFADTVRGFDEQKAMAYVDACEAYAMVLNNDEKTPDFLYKAAETAHTLKTFEKSFALYDWIIEKYPKSPRAPIALFMKGFIFDATLHDSANAAKFYSEFISKYPNAEFVKDAKVLMSNLGKSDEEVLKSIREKGGN